MLMSLFPRPWAYVVLTSMRTGRGIYIYQQWIPPLRNGDSI